MQLRLIRFHLLVPLFVILIQAEAPKGLSRVPLLTPSPMGMPYHRVSPSSSHEDRSSGRSYHRSGSGSPEVDDLGKRDREDKWSQRRFDSRTELEGKSGAKAMISNPSYSPTFLAEKLAQEALGSKEMQDTIKELTSLKGGNKHHKEFANEPSKVFHPSAMSHGAGHEGRKINSGDNNHLKHRTERNRKHRKHKNRGRKHHHKGRSKRTHSREKGSSKTARKRKSSKSVKRARRNGLKGQCHSSEESVTYRRKKCYHKTPKTIQIFTNKLQNDREPSGNRNESLIEEELPNHESRRKIYKRTSTLHEDKNNQGSYYGKGIIAKLMLTTTQDPNKKKNGDQGVEYSEYYSDNDNVLLPKLVIQSKLDEPVKNSALGGVRSVREIADDDFFHQYNYPDPADDEMLEDDVDRPKRSGHRSVKIVQEPFNSMEYVDSSDVPVQADGTVNNERIPSPYSSGFNNYVSNQNERIRNAHSTHLNNPNANPSITNVKNRLLDNVPSQMPQPYLAQNGNPSYYSASEMPTAQSAALPVSTASPNTAKTSGNIVVNIPEDGRLMKTSSAAPILLSSNLLPASRSAVSGGNGKVSAPNSPGKGRSMAKSSLATIRTTSASIDGGSSKLQDMRSDIDAAKVSYFDHRDGIENIRSPDQIEALALREVMTQGTTTRGGKTNGTCSTNSTSLKPGDPRSVNSTLMANETKAVASEILSEIIGELEELKFENPKDEQKEGLPCRLTGSWVTSRAGVRIDMKVTNHSVLVNLDYLTPPIATEGLLNVTWNVTGFAPFKRGGPFSLLATNNHTKTLAVFVGSCKVCQGIDTIEGSWTVSREPRDCRDFQMSTNIFNEIFRRTRLFSAIKEKQNKHEAQLSTTLFTPSVNSSSSSGVTSMIQEEPVNLGKQRNQTS